MDYILVNTCQSLTYFSVELLLSQFLLFCCRVWLLNMKWQLALKKVIRSQSCLRNQSLPKGEGYVSGVRMDSESLIVCYLDSSVSEQACQVCT